MADLNKQALEMWNAMKPMVDREIDQQTKGAVQRRKAKVTTAPSLVTKKIGVTEPFGDQYFIPYDAKVAGANVGDVVWIEYMYGASNSFASMFAKAVEDPRSCSATLSSAGWYRVLHVENPTGSISRVIDLTITRNYVNANNESHCIKYIGNYNSHSFNDEISKSNTILVDKVRYITDSNYGYVDIHYAGTSANKIAVDFECYADIGLKQSCVAESLQSVADAPSGETVVTAYTFNKNNGNPLVFKSQYYASASLYNASGSFVNELRWQENEDYSIWILSGYATLTVTARNGANPGLTINLPSTFKGQSALYRVGSQTQYQKEHLYLQLTNGSSTCTLRTSESWNNLAVGEVRFYVYQTIIFNR